MQENELWDPTMWRVWDLTHDLTIWVSSLCEKVVCFRTHYQSAATNFGGSGNALGKYRMELA